MNKQKKDHIIIEIDDDLNEIEAMRVKASFIKKCKAIAMLFALLALTNVCTFVTTSNYYQTTEQRALKAKSIKLPSIRGFGRNVGKLAYSLAQRSENFKKAYKYIAPRSYEINQRSYEINQAFNKLEIQCADMRMQNKKWDGRIVVMKNGIVHDGENHVVVAAMFIDIHIPDDVIVIDVEVEIASFERLEEAEHLKDEIMKSERRKEVIISEFKKDRELWVGDDWKLDGQNWIWGCETVVRFESFARHGGQCGGWDVMTNFYTPADLTKKEYPWEVYVATGETQEDAECIKQKINSG